VVVAEHISNRHTSDHRHHNRRCRRRRRRRRHPRWRPKAVDYEIGTGGPWNYALTGLSGPGAGPAGAGGRDGDGLVFDPTPAASWSPSLAFDDADGAYPFSITAAARALSDWGFWSGSKIVAEAPASPVRCAAATGHGGGGGGGGGGGAGGGEGGEEGQCGPETQVRLVPFGGTNIRISVFPWVGK
jgi:hypothetical protein